MAEADVAKKTFFNHFPTKEDVVFAESERYYDAVVEALAERRADEDVPDVLMRTYEEVIERYLEEGAPAGDRETVETYGQLLMTVPAVQAKGLLRMLDLQRRMAEALVHAFPDELDPVAAAVGALIGAAQAIGVLSVERGHTAEESLAETRRAVEIVMRGVRSLGRSGGH